MKSLLYRKLELSRTLCKPLYVYSGNMKLYQSTLRNLLREIGLL